MTRGWAIFALVVALFTVGYERFVGIDVEAPSVQEDTLHSLEGGDGQPPPPNCASGTCP